MTRSRRWWPMSLAVAMSGCALLLGASTHVAGAGRTTDVEGVLAGVRPAAEDRPALWVYQRRGGRDAAGDPGRSAGGGVVGNVAGAIVHLMLPGTLQAEAVDRPVTDDGAVLQVGLNLSAYRRGHGGEFADDSLNRALHELGLANAREVVVSARPAADRLRPLALDVLVSYRSRPPGQYTRIELSMPGPRVTETGGAEVSESWVRPRLGEWVDACIDFHRASLSDEDRPSFDQTLRQWRLDHGEAQRRVFTILRGPIVLTESGGAPCVLIGVRSSAEGRSLREPLTEVLESIGCGVDLDDRTGEGTIGHGALEGTTLSSLVVRVGQWRDAWWIGVAREPDAQPLRDMLR